MMKLLKAIIVWALLTLPVQAQKSYKYRVTFKDKANTEYSVDRPQEFLSMRAIERRNRQQLPIDSTDLPVSGTYLETVEKIGASVVATSKWNNTALVTLNVVNGVFPVDST